ncbi:inovirus Gp2 family protein [Vibrio scophthalmi]|uniref:YagK/YfjJ C-terminal domain-containing protein n=1 Tax=Vibrio scophthalmi TaxID=45658 RepID=A0A1C7FFN9_9VIBR|nr:inovirus Gp2 family protein [Vibrio scophthalmi]ANU38154.1 uncharacterized protein VSVS05_03116 [Vibrio scophthalmi]
MKYTNKQVTTSTITYSDMFEGRTILKNKSGCVIRYLKNILNVMDRALACHPRTMAVRIDLRMPNSSLVDSQNVIARFISSLKSQVSHDIERKIVIGRKVRQCRINYTWVKERETALNSHYHVVLFFNKDVYNCLGDFSKDGNLSSRIKKAWNSALGSKCGEYDRLVEFTKNGIYHLDSNSDSFDVTYDDLFKRLSYFAKVETKEYGDKKRNFGCSSK